MTERIGGALVVLAFAVIGLSWPVLNNVWAEDVAAPQPSTRSQIDKVIAFCSDETHQGSPLCTVADPTDDEQVKQAVEDAIADAPTSSLRTVTTRIQETDDDDGGGGGSSSDSKSGNTNPNPNPGTGTNSGGGGSTSGDSKSGPPPNPGHS